MGPSVDEVKDRLEDLFSKKNLTDDAFLQKHLSAQMYIPVALVARHERMKSFCTDKAVIISAAKLSASLGVDDDEQMIRPAFKPTRNTIMLRDLPWDVSEGELTFLFATCPQSDGLFSVKPDVNNTAFAIFNSDEAAQSAALWLRSQKLRGAEIKCAMKSEQMVRSFFPAGPATQQAPMPPYVVPEPSAMPLSWPPAQGQALYDGSSEFDSVPAVFNSNFDAIPYDGMYDGAYEGDGWMAGGWGPGGLDLKGKGKGLQGKGGQPVDDMMSQFEQDSMFEDDGMIEAGYGHEYRKYSREYIIEICNSMVDIVKPDAYKQLETNEDAMSLFREEPCREWAPLPSLEPLFPTEEKRSAEDQGGDFGGGSEWTANSWNRTNPRRRQPWSHGQDLETYHEEADWVEDSSWGWDSSAWWVDSRPKWVEKGRNREGEEGADSQVYGARQLNWAEKVRGSESAGHRWVAKKKAEPEDGDEQKKAETAERDEKKKPKPDPLLGGFQ